MGVQRVEDPHHPRGYRELRSPAEMRKMLNRKIRQQAGICAICHEEFTDYNDIVPDHRDPKGMGGAWRDDHPDNIQATYVQPCSARVRPGFGGWLCVHFVSVPGRSRITIGESGTVHCDEVSSDTSKKGLHCVVA